MHRRADDDGDLQRPKKRARMAVDDDMKELVTKAMQESCRPWLKSSELLHLEADGPTHSAIVQRDNGHKTNLWFSINPDGEVLYCKPIPGGYQAWEFVCTPKSSEDEEDSDPVDKWLEKKLKNDAFWQPRDNEPPLKYYRAHPRNSYGAVHWKDDVFADFVKTCPRDTKPNLNVFWQRLHTLLPTLFTKRQASKTVYRSKTHAMHVLKVRVALFPPRDVCARALQC